MLKIIIFLIISIPIVIVSWRSIFSFRNHGFYRFISWECILWLFVSNIAYWFKDWYSITQIISWLLLFSSIPVVLLGVAEMKKAGKQDQNRDTSLYQFEKTSSLVETGIFNYIRHPLYGSLLLLTWGIFFKHLDYFLFIISVISTFALIMTARMEEKENIRYFGDIYSQYMKRTKMFIPYII